MPEDPKPRTKVEKEEKLIAKLEKWYRLADTPHTKWVGQAQRNLDFYLGKQWDSEDLNKLKAEKRPALTFNHIKSVVNLVSGHERQNRRDIKAVNKKGGTRIVAEALTKLIKDIMDDKEGSYEKSHAFLKAIIMSRGWLTINLDFDDDLVNGNIIVEEMSPFRIKIDPFMQKYDMRDGMFIFKEEWLPKDKIEQTFPSKKKDLESLDVADKDMQPVIDYGDTYKEGGETIDSGEIKEYKYRVKECWWREYKTTKILYNVQNGQSKDVTEVGDEKLNKIAKISDRWKVVRRTKPVLNLSMYVGKTILENIEDPFNGVTMFPLVPIYAYWIEGEWRGLIDDLQDPQQEINKRKSQLLHHLNLSANSGWMGDEDAVADWDVVEQFGSKPGVIIKTRKGKKLERLSPMPMSEGHLIIAKDAENAIKIISGVNADLLGMDPERQESGIAMQLRQRQGNVVIESMFDNLHLSEKILGKLLIEMIQKSGAYSREEMVKVVIDGEEKDVALNKKTKSLFGAIQKIENDLSIGRYDIAVTTSPSMPTVRMANLHVMLTMAKQGLPVPPDMIIEQSDIPNKEELKDRMKSASQRPSPEETEAKFKQAELALKAKIEKDKLTQEAQLKREEFALKVELKEMDIRAKVLQTKFPK